MTAARPKLPPALELLLLYQLEEAITQANLGEFDTAVAKRYLIAQIPHIDIAAELGYGRTTITEHIPRIVAKVEWAAQRLFGTTATQ